MAKMQYFCMLAFLNFLKQGNMSSKNAFAGLIRFRNVRCIKLSVFDNNSIKDEIIVCYHFTKGHSPSLLIHRYRKQCHVI